MLARPRLKSTVLNAATTKSIAWGTRAAEQEYPKAKVFLEQHLTAKENMAELIAEARQRRQEEFQHHAERLQEIRQEDDYLRIGTRVRK